MSYIEDSLSEEEHIVDIFKIHWLFWANIIFWGALISLFIIGIPVFIYWILKYRGIERGVTNKRVVSKWGIIGRETDEMKLSSIETVEITQSVWGRILDFGTVRITGRGESVLLLNHLDDPMKVKRVIESVRPDTSAPADMNDSI